MEFEGLILVLLVTVVSLVGVYIQHSRLNDPDDKGVVEIKELKKVAILERAGEFEVSFFRQSGNLYKDSERFQDGERALNSAISTIKRAKIPFVAIDCNTSAQLVIRRPYHCHRGRQEGKKIGSIVVTRIAAPSLVQKPEVKKAAKEEPDVYIL